MPPRFIEQATETETPLPEIFELVRGFLNHLCAQPPSPQTIFALELKLLRELGLAPDPDELSLTPGAKKIVQTLLAEDWRTSARLKLSGPQTGEVGQFLNGFLVFHLGRLPRGRAPRWAVARLRASGPGHDAKNLRKIFQCIGRKTRPPGQVFSDLTGWAGSRDQTLRFELGGQTPLIMPCLRF